MKGVLFLLEFVVLCDWYMGCLVMLLFCDGDLF